MTLRFPMLERWVGAIADVRKLRGLVYLPRFISHWRAYQRIASHRRDDRLNLSDAYPCLSDWLPSTPYDPHYFYQGAWLAQKLAGSATDLHVDVGSSVLAIGVLSAQVRTVFVDYRPLKAKLPNLQSVGGSISSLPFADGSILSLSCMHVIEHIGLGRYGDSLDPDGAERAAAELSRVLGSGGRLYLTAPVGRDRICFNAHRVFAPLRVRDMFPSLRLRSFSWVDDSGRFNAIGRPEDAAQNEYACGFYEFDKSLV